MGHEASSIQNLVAQVTWILGFVHPWPCYLPIVSVIVAFLGAFAKLQNATISFVMSVRPSVCPHRVIRLPLDGFSLNLIFEFFRKCVEAIQVLLKFDKNNGLFT